MKRTALLACALMAACASIAHAELPAASAGPSTDVVVSPAMNLAAYDEPMQLVDPTVFVAGMSGAYTLPVIHAASHFASASIVAHESHAGFDTSAAFSPPLYEQAPPFVHSIGKRAARHSRELMRWRT